MYVKQQLIAFQLYAVQIVKIFWLTSMEKLLLLPLLTKLLQLRSQFKYAELLEQHKLEALV